MKNLLLMCLLSICMPCVSNAYAQSVTGKVVSGEDNSPIPGVNVLIKGTSSGVVTDLDGIYKVNASTSDVLVFSYVGFLSQEVAVGSRSVLDVTLAPDIQSLSEVVVTALGISREKKSLTYAAEEIDGDELTKAKDASFINAIAGKTAGVQINRSGSGVGGSTRVILRGNSSTSNNQVLYVIDGVPMNNTSPAQPNDIWGQGPNGTAGSGRDGGDAISNLNPDDIESMTVLKGASASALYGVQGVNGVILITTKSGKAGRTKVSFSSNFTTETAIERPDLQFKYGQTADGSLDSWGGVVNAPDHVDDFFETGKTWINSVSLSGGTERSSTYFSYANTSSSGILPTSRLEKHNFNFKQTGKFLNDKLSATANINVITQDGNNRATSGLYFNPLTGLYQFPRGLDFSEYQTNFEVFDANRNTNVQNWIADKDTQQNPYWIINRNRNEDERTRLLGNLTLTYNLSDALSVRLKGTMDKTFDKYEQRAFASTQLTLADNNGRYFLTNRENTQQYGEVLLTFNKQLEELSFTALAGTSINDNRSETEIADSKGGDLVFANKFAIQNIGQPGSTFRQIQLKEQTQSIFGSVNIGYKNILFLDLGARNDWSSTLSFSNNDSFFYPTIGLTGVISDMVELPSSFDFLKARVTYAQVGGGLSPFDTNTASNISGGSNQVPTLLVKPGTVLEPETKKSLEFGVEMKMLDNRASLDLTYYDNTTENQRFVLAAPPSELGAQNYIFNAGEISNKGWEIGLGLVPVRTSEFEWNVNVNYARNKNKVEELLPEEENDFFFISAPGVNNYAFGLSKGGVFGELYGVTFKRSDDGKIVVDANGVPLVADGEAQGLNKIADINPDFTLGINNEINYKDFSLSFLIDGRFGGDVMSITEAMNDLLGVSQTTAAARDAGGVNIDVVLEDGTAFTGTIDPQSFYTTVGGRAGITENYVYSATNIRLRELSVGYSIPTNAIDFISTAKLSLVGRNLFFLKNDAPFDPDLSMSTGNGLQGVDTYMIPSTRSLGFNLSVTF